MSKRKASSKPRKQRKRHFNAPLHTRQKKMAATLSKELREKYKRRSFPVRTGDTVKILRGDYAGITGKVVEVNLKNYTVLVDKAKRRKTNGEEVLVPIHPSNLMITELNLEDDRRRKRLEVKLK